MPKRYRAAHSLWKNLSFVLIIGGLISLFWVPWWAGLGATVLGFIMAPAVQKSASQFVLEYALEDEAFFMEMQAAGVVRAENANASS